LQKLSAQPIESQFKLENIVLIFSKFLMSFPYHFGGLPTKKFKTLLLERLILKKHFGVNVFFNIMDTYSAMIAGIAEQDHEFLQQILEPNLFEKVQKGLSDLKEMNYTMRIEDAPTYLGDGKIEYEIEDEARVLSVVPTAAFGASINRLENMSREDAFLELSLPNGNRQYFLSKNNISSLWKKRVLSLTAFMLSPKNLSLYDEQEIKMITNDSIEFKKMKKKEEEKDQEIEEEKDQPNIYGSTKKPRPSFANFELHSVRLEGYSPQFDWVITDLDNKLNGNPYFGKRIGLFAK
jgi:hypothetical protein